MPENLEFHDITVQEQTGFTTGGKPEVMKLLTFHVGDHGPFYKRFTREEYTGEKAMAAMVAERDELAKLTVTGA